MGLAVDPEEFAEVTIYFSGMFFEVSGKILQPTWFTSLNMTLSRYRWVHDNRRSLHSGASC